MLSLAKIFGTELSSCRHCCIHRNFLSSWKLPLVVVTASYRRFFISHRFPLSCCFPFSSCALVSPIPKIYSRRPCLSYSPSLSICRPSLRSIIGNFCGKLIHHGSKDAQAANLNHYLALLRTNTFRCIPHSLLLIPC
jgi:hypothetical protein